MEREHYPSCFFMYCKDDTEKEALERGLFGDKEWRLNSLKSIRKGDFGFLLNISQDKLLGVFEAETEVRLNIEPDAWDGRFPAQVKVKLIEQLEEPKAVYNASEKLKKFIRLKEIKKGGFSFKIPAYTTYGPLVTEKVLLLFELNEKLKKYESPETITKEAEKPIKLDDVAGMDEVKEFVRQRIVEPLEDEETAYKLGLRIGGGILLFGPPGTGKTLISRAIANQIDAKFVDVSPSVIQGYPGEAEKKIEEIFKSLEKEPRAVVFFDEAEWILKKREQQASTIMQRVVPLLLAQLSKIFEQRQRPIIVIAATNKPKEIDTAFLRPGRFDRSFYVGLPDKKTREKIVKICLKNRENELNEDDIEEIAEVLDGYSGADIRNVIEEAASIAFKRRKENKARITKYDIVEAKKRIFPSVKKEEVEEMEEWAKERGIKIK